MPSKPSIYDGNNVRITARTPLLSINETIDLKCESNGGNKIKWNSVNTKKERKNEIVFEKNYIFDSFLYKHKIQAKTSEYRLPPGSILLSL